MLRNYLLAICCLSFISAFAQKEEVLKLSSFYPFPAKEIPSPKDLSVSSLVEVSKDSIYFSIDITDDQLFVNGDPSQSDRVEIWFAMNEVNFSDYIVAGTKKNARMFRNSAEAGDNANLTNFLKNGDYPAGEKIEYQGKLLKSAVPERKDLREDRVFFGMSHFSFTPKDQTGRQLDRDKYDLMQAQLGGLPDNLSSATSCKTEIMPNGYRLQIAMHNRCLSFAQQLTKNFKFCIDVFDKDDAVSAEQMLSSTPNRFYARPYYFNKAVLKNPLNIRIDGVDQKLIEKTGINLYLFFSDGTWKGFGFGNGAIVYTDEVVSESNLVEYTFYPLQVNPVNFPDLNGLPVRCMSIDYKDFSPFRQQDLYFLYNNEVVISRGYNYQIEKKSDFINRPVLLPNGQVAFVLYDFEPADPHGWGEYGKMADEFVYIQQVGSQPKSLYSGGQRVEKVHTATFGEKDQTSVNQVKDIIYTWIEPGKRFQIEVKGLDKSSDKRFVFRFTEEGEFRLEK
jgi:hypothetical protein